jgi:hypothetical protein
MTTLISSLDLRYYKNTKLSVTDIKKYFEFHLKQGVLVGIESMLNCFSNESDMMYDHYIAIQTLQNVYLHFPSNVNSLISETNSIFINLEW